MTPVSSSMVVGDYDAARETLTDFSYRDYGPSLLLLVDSCPAGLLGGGTVVPCLEVLRAEFVQRARDPINVC